MLDYFIKKAHEQMIVPFPRPRVVVGVPELVDKFNQWIKQEHQQQVVGRQRVNAEMKMDPGPMLGG